MSFVPLNESGAVSVQALGPVWEVWGGWKNVPIIPWPSWLLPVLCRDTRRREQGLHPKVTEVVSHFWGVWLCWDSPQLPMGRLAAALAVLGLVNYFHVEICVGV